MTPESDPLWIVKIGGSVFSTEKEQGLLDSQLLGIIAGYLDDVRQSHSLIVVHGTGYISKEFARANHILHGKIEAHRRQVVANCLHMLRNIHSTVLCALVDAGMPIVPLSPLTFCELRSGQAEITRPELLRSVLRGGFVPLLHGDLVVDKRGDFLVCSSDALVEGLIRLFPAEKLLFATDVPGVYLQDPKRFPGGEPIDDLSWQELDRLAGQPDDAEDVSGALPAKLKIIRRATDGFRDCYVFDGRSPSAWDALVHRNERAGTLIRGQAR